jgi:outer membrane protein assembly factor BamB
MTGTAGSNRRELGAAGVLLLCGLALSGCADAFVGMSMPSLPKIDDINPWAEKPTPLPGKRVAVIQQENVATNLAAADRPLMLPPPRQNEAWSEPGGVPSNAPGHLALTGAGQSAWSADAGRGSSFYGRLTASPIVYEDKVYTLDAGGRVTAFSASSGTEVWRMSVTPPNEKDQEGFGGGLAADGGRIYAGTGFGYVVALDARTGNKLWEKSLEAPVRSSPTAVGERVFALTKEGQVYCLSGSDGSELWAFRGMPERASLLSNASPAVDGEIVVVPYPTGDLVALHVSTGRPVWSESLARTHMGSSMSALSDVARPAIDGGTVFAVGHGGRMIATAQKTGERLWSLTVASSQAPWVAGDTVFVVDTTGQLMAIARRDGKIQWTVKLAGSNTWSGPVLAGNRLWLASNKGQLVGVDAATGRVETKQDLGQPVFIAPVVAGGRMYVLTDKAKLIALN